MVHPLGQQLGAPRGRRWFFFAVPLLVAAACAGPTFIAQHYAGDPRPPSTIAILRINGAEAVQLVEVDGEDASARVAPDARLHVEVLPGRHRVRVWNAAFADDPPQSLEFVAEAARVYRPLFLAAPLGAAPGLGVRSIARIYEVDARNDALLRDATAEARPTAAPDEPTALRPRPAAAPAPTAAEDADAGLSPALDAGELDAGAPDAGALDSGVLPRLPIWNPSAADAG